MISATDFRLRAPARRTFGLLIVGLSLADLGCARLRSYSHDYPPMLGAAEPSEAVSGTGLASSGDLYADRMAGAVDRANVALAKTTRTTAHPSAVAESDATTPGGPVALQPPVALSPALPTATDSPAASPAPEIELAETPAAPTASSVVAESRARLESLKNYQVQMNRQERVAGKLGEPEDVILSIRREPASVRLEWPSGPHKKREVLYSAGADGGMMHINMADSLLPVPRLTLPPDSPLVMNSSRHPITEAGFDDILKKIEDAIRGEQAGDPAAGKVTYEGLEQAEQVERPSHKIVRKTPSGEAWTVYIDPESHLPSLVQAVDGKGELLERYVFRNPRVDVAELAQADAFDPNARWGPQRGLLNRLARANGDAKKAPSSQPQ